MYKIWAIDTKLISEEFWGRKFSSKVLFLIAHHTVCFCHLHFALLFPDLFQCKWPRPKVFHQKNVSSQTHHKICSLFPWKPEHHAAGAAVLGKHYTSLVVHGFVGALCQGETNVMLELPCSSSFRALYEEIDVVLKPEAKKKTECWRWRWSLLLSAGYSLMLALCSASCNTEANNRTSFVFRHSIPVLVFWAVWKLKCYIVLHLDNLSSVFNCVFFKVTFMIYFSSILRAFKIWFPDSSVYQVTLDTNKKDVRFTESVNPVSVSASLLSVFISLQV